LILNFHLLAIAEPSHRLPVIDRFGVDVVSELRVELSFFFIDLFLTLNFLRLLLSEL
jgi:hypothetical protein